MGSLTIQTLIITTFLLTIPTSFASPPTLHDVFEQCLTDFKPSNPKSPIQNFIYTQQNPKFLIILNDYVRNLRYFNNTTRKPVAIVAAADVSHIQATISCAKKLGLQLRIRSGGHDYDGMSYVSPVDFVVLDMFNLRSIKIDPKLETAWVQAGATLGEIYYGVANISKDLRGFPAGICPGLGAGGHFSGGGYGNMMRKYGLTIDNIIDAKIVDAKGRVLDRSSMGEDLFWALRGGGAASFCVVLAWKIKLVPVPPKVTVFNVETVGNRSENTMELVAKFQEIAYKIDNELFIRLTLGSSNKTVKASFMGMFLGNSAKLLEIMNAKFPELGLKQTECIEMKWIESVLFWLSIPPVFHWMILANGPSRVGERSSPKRIEGVSGKNLQLQFRSRLFVPLFTGGKIEGEQGAAIHVLLLDMSTRHVLTVGPEASAKLDVVVLDGDFFL